MNIQQLAITALLGVAPGKLACLAYRATKDLKLVSQLMGHSGIQITADIYTSLFEEVDRAAAEAVAAIVPRTVRVHHESEEFFSRCAHFVLTRERIGHE